MIPDEIANGSLSYKRTWFLNQIKEFLKKFVFDEESLDQLDSLANKVIELKEYDAQGFLCRYSGCDQKYKYHSGRVK